MRKNILFLLVFLCSFSIMYAQKEGLGDINNPLGAGNSHYLYVPTNSIIDNNTYCVKVYIHKITKTHDPTSGVDDATLNQQVQILQNYFDASGNSGIEFVWDGNILEVNDDEIYKGEDLIIESGICFIGDFTSLNSYSHSDGIDLFFFDVDLIASVSDGIANETRALISKSQISTAAIAHEVGHIFGLFHTYHGTYGEGSDNCENNILPQGQDSYGDLVECPSMTAAERASKGDFVSDTPPDKGPDDAQYNNNNCTISFVPGNLGFCNGDWDFGTISSQNLMGHARAQTCFSHFTLGQIRRMKYFLKRRPVLQAAIAPSCTLTDCSKKCKNNDIIPEFTFAIDKCLVTFNGRNDGRYCDNDTYEWFIDGEVVSTTENYSHTFTLNGTYMIEFRINRSGICEETISRTLTVDNCSDDPPTCPDNRCLNIVEVENCEDYQAWMNCGDPDIDYVEFYYTIGTYNRIYAGTSTGNYTGRYASPIYLPDPPSIGSWNNYNLIVYAVTYFKEGTICDEIFTTTRLNCSGNNGDSPLKMYPNPTKSSTIINFEGIESKDIKTIEIIDLKGNFLSSEKPSLQQFDVKGLKPGVYIAHFKMISGEIAKMKFVVNE